MKSFAFGKFLHSMLELTLLSEWTDRQQFRVSLVCGTVLLLCRKESWPSLLCRLEWRRRYETNSCLQNQNFALLSDARPYHKKFKVIRIKEWVKNLVSVYNRFLKNVKVMYLYTTERHDPSDKVDVGSRRHFIRETKIVTNVLIQDQLLKLFLWRHMSHERWWPFIKTRTERLPISLFLSDSIDQT